MRPLQTTKVQDVLHSGNWVYLGGIDIYRYPTYIGVSCQHTIYPETTRYVYACRFFNIKGLNTPTTEWYNIITPFSDTHSEAVSWSVHGTLNTAIRFKDVDGIIVKRNSTQIYPI